MFNSKLWNIDNSFQLKRNPILGLFRIMEPIGGIIRLLRLIPLIALFIGGGLSCKSDELGPCRSSRHDNMKMVS